MLVYGLEFFAIHCENMDVSYAQQRELLVSSFIIG